jgi:hypothetical protein
MCLGSSNIIPPDAFKPESVHISTTLPSQGDSPHDSALDLTPQDVVDREILSTAQAERLVAAFHASFDGPLSVLRVRNNLSSYELRRRQPLLWLSMLCVASSRGDVGFDLVEILHCEMSSILKEQLTNITEPSLELLQATRQYLLYHYEPTLSTQPSYLDYFDLANRMIVPLVEKVGFPNGKGLDVSKVFTNGAMLEISRELLICYWSCFV